MNDTLEMPTPDTPQVLLEHHLKTLRLPTILSEYDKVARQCATEQVDYPRYLLRLTELELLDRDRRAVERRIRQAKFPVVKSLDSFEFLAIPSLNKTLVLELARCEFLSRKENLLLFGQQWHRQDSHRPGSRPVRLPTRSSCAIHDCRRAGQRADRSPRRQAPAALPEATGQL
jgi:hypothetical protein